MGIPVEYFVYDAMKYFCQPIFLNFCSFNNPMDLFLIWMHTMVYLTLLNCDLASHM